MLNLHQLQLLWESHSCLYVYACGDTKNNSSIETKQWALCALGQGPGPVRVCLTSPPCMYTYLMGKPVRELFLGSAFAEQEPASAVVVGGSCPSPADGLCAGPAPAVLSAALLVVAAAAATGVWAGWIPQPGLAGVRLSAPRAASQTPRGLTAAGKGKSLMRWNGFN